MKNTQGTSKMYRYQQWLVWGTMLELQTRLLVESDTSATSHESNDLLGVCV
jgi:hypothetical protein